MSNSLKRYKKIPSRDNTIKQLQNHVQEVVNPIVDKEVLDGVLVKDVCLEALKANLIEHKLGRKPLGFLIVRKRADSRIWDIQDDNSQPSKTFALTCSHDVQVDIWIF